MQLGGSVLSLSRGRLQIWVSARVVWLSPCPNQALLVDSVLELAFFFLLKVPEKKKVVKKDQSVSSGKNQNYPDSTPGSKEDSLWTLETPQVGTNFPGFAGSCCLQSRTEAVALSELALGIQTRAAARAAHSFPGM